MALLLRLPLLKHNHSHSCNHRSAVIIIAIKIKFSSNLVRVCYLSHTRPFTTCESSPVVVAAATIVVRVTTNISSLILIKMNLNRLNISPRLPVSSFPRLPASHICHLRMSKSSITAIATIFIAVTTINMLPYSLIYRRHYHHYHTTIFSDLPSSLPSHICHLRTSKSSITTIATIFIAVTTINMLPYSLIYHRYYHHYHITIFSDLPSSLPSHICHLRANHQSPPLPPFSSPSPPLTCYHIH